MRIDTLHRYILAFAAVLAGYQGPAVAEDTPSAVKTIVTCPAEIPNFRISYTTKYTPPAGWGHADAYARAKKGGVYDGLTLVLHSHAMKDSNIICNYATGATESHLKLATIRKIVPRGTECNAISDFRFECVTR